MFKRLQNDEVPKRRRRDKKPTLFELTPEWPMLRNTLAKGDFRPQETFSIEWTPGDMEKYRIKDARICTRFIKNYLKEYGFPYVVTSYISLEGNTVILIKNEPVISQTA